MKFPLVILALYSLPTAANETLLEAVQEQVEANHDAVEAQKNIDRLNEETRHILEEYRETLRQTEALHTYNAYLQRLVETQQADKRSLEKQLRELDTTRRELIPFMLRMREILAQFVSLDRPFHKEKRTLRLKELHTLLERPDVSDSEKFRHLLEVYQSENEYGKTLETYRDVLGNPPVRTVDFLRIGRIGLFYCTLDGKEAGVWDHHTQSWHTLPMEYIGPVQKGLAIAKKENPPEFLPLALDPPETSQ